jgi:hypothetical protein
VVVGKSRLTVQERQRRVDCSVRVAISPGRASVVDSKISQLRAPIAQVSESDWETLSTMMEATKHD